MLVGPSGVGDCREKGDVVGCIDTLLSVDDGSVVSINVGGVDGGDKIEGHSMVIDAITFFAEVGVLKRVGVGDVNSGSWGERVIFEGREDIGIAVDECPEAGRGHDGDESSS